ncbi:MULTISPECIES: hypothetical protein [unclassified Haladaptatus]|uniref:hypothetical protein n=1 Tax=unclassified Haladaptatus TaxID=2622732 RepID=UPI00209C18A5|nr:MULTISPECIES: hypothetical protein [unclassified Haladaptatus]MCO8244084.1 hypothetical protein [Haladaptatus sp. AB643]MCO8255890.1 hypothetical protein [Haladaptatus sp. AB618]
MGLDVPAPDPPTLQAEMDVQEYDDVSVAGERDYHRDELEDFLREGAWEESFDQWAEHTDLEEREFETALELDLFSEFDFFWDDFANRVGYHAPGIPEDWKVRDIHPDIDSWNAVSSINASLTELGQVVCDVLAENYVDWEAEFEAPDDLPDF